MLNSLPNKEFILPKIIKQGEFSNPYKVQIINENYTYHCRHRTICKIAIKLDKENLITQ